MHSHDNTHALHLRDDAEANLSEAEYLYYECMLAEVHESLAPRIECQFNGCPELEEISPVNDAVNDVTLRRDALTRFFSWRA
jgi:hypothetical protein